MIPLRIRPPTKKPMTSVQPKIVQLTKPQYRLLTTDSKFPAFVGGFGSGKTQALIARAIARKLDYPTCNVGYYLPTFDLVRTIAFPRFCEQLEDMGLRADKEFKLNKTYATLELKGAGQFIFRTMDNPERIVGYEVADSLVDELDTLKIEDARNVWNKIIARNRQKKPDGSVNTVAVGTTPEGFRFVYEKWGRNKEEALAKGYELIKASTMSNARNLPADYIDSLRNSYPSNLLAAYVDGEFVNLTTGSVYPNFDRKLNGCNTTIRKRSEDGRVAAEPLHIGMDFNVGNMAATILVLRDGKPHQVGEYAGIIDTPNMISKIKADHGDHMIIVYPDSSGKNRRSADASISDLSLLRQARFNVIATTQNPAVKDRVLSFNKLIDSRDFKINVDECPLSTEALEKQAYTDKGEPDKTSGFDHLNDASGYTIVSRWPIRSLGMVRMEISGI